MTWVTGVWWLTLIAPSSVPISMPQCDIGQELTLIGVYNTHKQCDAAIEAIRPGKVKSLTFRCDYFQFPPRSRLR